MRTSNKKLLLLPTLMAGLSLMLAGRLTAQTFTTLYSFTKTSGPGHTNSDGANPSGVLLSGNTLYGTAKSGGNSGNGTVFKLNTDGTGFRDLHGFSSTNNYGNNDDGAVPQTALVMGGDGNFYGTTYSGGSNGYGTVFQVTSNGVLITLVSFNDTNGTTHGTGGKLVVGRDGNVYGETYKEIFEVSTSGALTKLVSYSRDASVNTQAGLVLGSDGSFYGTTAYGGSTDDGTVFQVTTNGVLSMLVSLDNSIGFGANALVLGSDGSLYGTSYYGGNVFRVTTDGVLTSLVSFNGTNGSYPDAALVLGRDGNFYGTTSSGGTNGAGTVFKITANGNLTSLYSFTGGNDGAVPQAALVQGRDGNFYGTTSAGGQGNSGTVFQLTVVPEQPQLTIIPSEATVILTWSTNYAGFTLHSTTNLATSAIWTSNSPPPVVFNGQNTVTNPISGTQQFFRLSQ